MLLTGSLDRHVRFFNIDGVENEKIQSLFLEDMPVHKAAFARSGAEVIVSGRRPFVYSIDLESQKVEQLRLGTTAKTTDKSLETFISDPQSNGKYRNTAYIYLTVVYKVINCGFIGCICHTVK